jgi:hypothetical protein
MFNFVCPLCFFVFPSLSCIPSLLVSANLFMIGFPHFVILLIYVSWYLVVGQKQQGSPYFD